MGLLILASIRDDELTQKDRVISLGVGIAILAPILALGFKADDFINELINPPVLEFNPLSEDIPSHNLPALSDTDLDLNR